MSEAAAPERVPQPEGNRGSLKWIQRAVEEKWETLEQPILEATGSKHIQWTSPLRTDGFAEYRGTAFLERIGASHLAVDLHRFWPRRGPQWDALGLTDRGQPLIIEAKAHIAEFCTPGSSAKNKSRSAIVESLRQVASDLRGKPGRDWTETFYQYGNRLAHLWFLRQHGLDAYLILVGFIGDREMHGPSNGEVWDAAYSIAHYALGISSHNRLSRYIVHVHPRVA